MHERDQGNSDDRHVPPNNQAYLNSYKLSAQLAWLRKVAWDTDERKSKKKRRKKEKRGKPLVMLTKERPLRPKGGGEHQKEEMSEKMV